MKSVKWHHDFAKKTFPTVIWLYFGKLADFLYGHCAPGCFHYFQCDTVWHCMLGYSVTVETVVCWDATVTLFPLCHCSTVQLCAWTPLWHCMLGCHQPFQELHSQFLDGQYHFGWIFSNFIIWVFSRCLLSTPPLKAVLLWIQMFSRCRPLKLLRIWVFSRCLLSNVFQI